MSEINGLLTAQLYRQWNMVYPEKGLVQVDTQVAMRQVGGEWEQAQLCNFNCATEHKGEATGGNYRCPAAFLDSKNLGMKRSTLMPAEDLVYLIATYVEGVRLAHREFLGKYFGSYCELAGLPYVARSYINQLIADKGKVRVNLFGGNSEVHPEILQIIKGLSGLDVYVDWTTVGAKIFLENAFLDELSMSPPAVICMSLDDAESADQLRAFFEMPLGELKRAFESTKVIWGQRRKLIAAVGAARKLRDSGFPSNILFNNVVHPNNIDWIHDLEAIIHDYVPAAKVNFYFAQAGFENKPGVWSEEQVNQCEQFVDYMIKSTLTLDRPWLTTRLHFWLTMKAIFIAYSYDWRIVRDALYGYHVWDCFSGPSFVGQIGGTYEAPVGGSFPPRVNLTGNCFWNSKTVNNQYLLDTPEEVSEYLLRGRVKLAEAQTNLEEKCSGCTFPRLMDDEFGLVFGLRPKVLEAYLGLRDRYVINF